MRCLSITTASAEVTVLQLFPSTFIEDPATMKPRDRAMSSSTLSGLDCECTVPQLGPNSYTSLWFQPGCGDHAVHGRPGWNRTATS